jgi:hypothetical protein
MISSVSEPEWDDEQVDLVIAEQLIRNLTGPNGEWMPDATNDELSDPNSYSGQRPVAKGPFTNWYEKERLDAQEAYRKSLGENANMNGVYFTVEKFEY